MQMDIDRYRPYLDRFDWPEEQKVAALTQVWAIMGSFVDRAFGTAPEQQRKLGSIGSQRADKAITAAKAIEPLASDAETALDCQDPITEPFNDAASQTKPARKKRR